MGAPQDSKGEKNVKRYARFFGTGVFALAMLLAHSVAVRAAHDVQLICLTEQPAIVEGESATLRAWVSTIDGRPIAAPVNFSWEVDAGRVEAQAASTRWDLSTVKVKPQMVRKVNAIVTAAQPGRSDLRCTVEVFIGREEATPPDRATKGELLSARHYLLPGEVEAPGFGLYSYLLFSAPPRDAEDEARYLKTIEACLLVLQEVDDYLSRHLPPSRLNATYIPLTRIPDRGRSNTEWAENLLAVYDYTAAQILLSKVQQAHQQGP